MFGKYGSPASAYKTVGLESSVSTADPHQLILLLFEGAQIAISTAKGEMSRGNIAEKGIAISKAIDIIGNGLRASLDMKIDSDLPGKLSDIYTYLLSRLLHANIHNDLAALDEVSMLLGEIHSAWIEIRPQVIT